MAGKDLGVGSKSLMVGLTILPLDTNRFAKECIFLLSKQAHDRLFI